jgi:hypothetical protein
MKAYYALGSTIRYYARLPHSIEEVAVGDAAGTCDLRGLLETDVVDVTRRWKESPSVVLANLDVASIPAVRTFLNRYGPLTGPSLQMPEAGTGRPRFYENLAKLTSFRDSLRRAWGNDADAIRELSGLVSYRSEVLIEGRLRVPAHGSDSIVVENSQIVAVVEPLKRFIVLLLLRDLQQGRAAVCQSPDCPAPYFLRERKGQQFCTHKCAVLVNVRKFREAQRKQKYSMRRKKR